MSETLVVTEKDKESKIITFEISWPPIQGEQTYTKNVPSVILYHPTTVKPSKEDTCLLDFYADHPSYCRH